MTALIHDLLPRTHGARITEIHEWDDASDTGIVHDAAFLDDARTWRAEDTGRVIRPEDITEFTVRVGSDVTAWTEGEGADHWTAIVVRERS